MTDAFAPHIEAVARKLCGEPNRALSSKTELRFGSQGSLSVDLAKGVWHHHEEGKGGGVLALIERETGHKNGEAVAWLRDELGADIPDNRPQAPAKAPPRIVATYDYPDEHGEVLFQVCRFDPKDFRQRKPKGEGWDYSVKGVRQVPYRLPELLQAVRDGQTIYIAEGEKDVDALWREGIAATTNAGGSGKWPEGLSEHFAGADVVILPDNDEAGRKHAGHIARGLQRIARRLRVLQLPDLPAKGDPSDWLASGGDGDQLRDLTAAKAEDWTPAPPESRFGAVPWSAMDTVTFRRDWLVEDIMFCGDFCLQYGASQSGKSFLAVDLALCVARGEPWFGKKTRKGGVLYQAGEGGMGLLSRLKAYRQEHGVKGDLPFVLLPKRVDLYAHEADNGIEAFLSEIAAQKAWLTTPLELVVIDTFATATPGANENASEDVSRALRNVQRIQEASGAAVLVVHHKNAGGEKPRGHTSLYANADAALEVIRSEENPSERTLRVAKVKDGEDGEKIGFTLESVEIGTYDDGKLITSCVVRPAQVGSGGSRRQPLPSGQYAFLSLLSEAINRYGGVMPVTTRIPAQTEGVQWEHFLTIYKAVQGVTLDDNAIRQALHRDGTKLTSRGLIGKDNPWVWLTKKGRECLRY